MASPVWQDGWYVVPYDVIFRDLDSFGHVNNAVFFTYFEIARTLLWFEITGSREPNQIAFIVARAECDFKRQVGMERIEIRVAIGQIRNSSFEFVYEIRKSATDEVAATGIVYVVLFDWARQSKLLISDELRGRLKECSRDAS